MAPVPPHRRIATALLILWALFALALEAAWGQQAASKPLVAAVDAVGMTVSDMDRAVEFYARVLTFEKVSDVEVAGSEYEHLQGVFGLRMRVVRMKLGDESIELTEYLVPKGRSEERRVGKECRSRW